MPKPFSFLCSPRQHAKPLENAAGRYAKRLKRPASQQERRLTKGTNVRARWGGRFYVGEIDTLYDDGDYDVLFSVDQSVAKMKRRDIQVV